MTTAEYPNQGGQALAAIWRTIASPDATLGLALETQVHNALHSLKSSPGDPLLVSRLERVALRLRVLMDAKQQGRVNFHASQLLRLRRDIAPLRGKGD